MENLSVQAQAASITASWNFNTSNLIVALGAFALEFQGERCWAYSCPRCPRKHYSGRCKEMLDRMQLCVHSFHC